MKISKIAKLIDGVVVGNKNLKIDGISKLEWATPKDITWSLLKKEKLKEDKTKAKVIITRPFFVMNSNKTYIFTDKNIDEILDIITSALSNEEVIEISSNIEKSVIISPKAYVEDKNVLIGEDTIISHGVVIEKNVKIGKNCNINANVILKSGTIIGDNVTVDCGSVIGNESFFTIQCNGKLKLIKGLKGVILNDHVYLGANTTIGKGIYRSTAIGEYTKIGSQVAIGHDTVVGKNCKIVSQSGIAGQATIGDNVTIYAQVGISDESIIGSNVTIYAKSGVKGRIKDFKEISGTPGIDHKQNIKLISKSWKELK